MSKRVYLNYVNYKDEIRAMYERVKDYNLTYKDFENGKQSYSLFQQEKTHNEYTKLVADLKAVVEEMDNPEADQNKIQERWRSAVGHITSCRTDFDHADSLMKDTDYELLKEEKYFRLHNFAYAIKDFNDLVENMEIKEKYYDFLEDKKLYEENHNSYKAKKNKFVNEHKNINIGNFLSNYQKIKYEKENNEKKINDLPSKIKMATIQYEKANKQLPTLERVIGEVNEQIRKNKSDLEIITEVNRELNDIVQESRTTAQRKAELKLKMSELDQELDKLNEDKDFLSEKIQRQDESVEKVIKNEEYKPYYERFIVINKLTLKEVMLEKFIENAPKDFEKYLNMSEHSLTYDMANWLKQYKDIIKDNESLGLKKNYKSYEEFKKDIKKRLVTLDREESEQLTEEREANKIDVQLVGKMQTVVNSNYYARMARDLKRKEISLRMTKIENDQKGIEFQDNAIRLRSERALKKYGKAFAPEWFKEEESYYSIANRNKFEEIVSNVAQKYNEIKHQKDELSDKLDELQDNFRENDQLVKKNIPENLKREQKELIDRNNEIDKETEKAREDYMSMRRLYEDYKNTRTERKQFIEKYKNVQIKPEVVSGSKSRADHLSEIVMKKTPEGRKNSKYFDDMKAALDSIRSDECKTQQDLTAKIEDLKQKAELYKAKKLEQRRPWPSTMRQVRLAMTDSIIAYCDMTKKSLELVSPQEEKEFKGFMDRSKHLETTREVGNFKKYMEKIQYSASEKHLKEKEDKNYKENKKYSVQNDINSEKHRKFKDIAVEKHDKDDASYDSIDDAVYNWPR